MKKIVKGAVFYVDLDLSVGSEQKGFRPCVVLQNNVGNIFSPTTIIAPISTKKGNRCLPTQVEVRMFRKLRPNSYVMAEQIRTIDKSRLSGFVCMLSDEEIAEIDIAVKVALDIR